MAKKLIMLKKAWIQKAYHATYSPYARRVSVLVNKSFPGEIEKAYIDTQGKYVILLYTIGQQRYITVAVYIPPSVFCGSFE